MQFVFFQGVEKTFFFLTPTVSRAYLLTQTHNYFTPDKIVLAVLPAAMLDCFHLSEKPQKTPCAIFSQVQKMKCPVIFSYQFHWLFRLTDSLMGLVLFSPPPFTSNYFSALNIINIFKMSQICMHQLMTMISIPPSSSYCSVFPQKFSV